MKAISTGMGLIHGDFVITLDADLQDPPEVIPEIISLYTSTLVPCIQTFRVDRRSDTLWKRKSAHLYYKLINRITGVQVIPHAADFRLLARKEAIMLAELTESKKIFRLLIPYFDIATLHFQIERGTRIAGESKYSFGKMIALAFDSLLAFSTRPLRWILFLSLSSLVLFLGFSTYAFIQWTRGYISPGWTSLSLLMSFGFTATLISLFIIGEYVSRIYVIALNRPGAIWSESTLP